MSSDMSHERATPDELLSSLGQRLGIDGLRFSEEGLCELIFDGGLRTITMHQRGNWLSAIQLQSHPLPAGDTLASQALAANFLWRGTNGATLALDSEQRLWAQRSPATAQPDTNDLLANLETLLDLAEAWQARKPPEESRPQAFERPMSLFLNRA